jgi:hypothetical protein
MIKYAFQQQRVDSLASPSRKHGLPIDFILGAWGRDPFPLLSPSDCKGGRWKADIALIANWSGGQTGLLMADFYLALSDLAGCPSCTKRRGWPGQARP